MISHIRLNANAKINLSLDVIEKRDDGYHEVSMIMQEIDLCDIVEIQKIDKNNTNKVSIELGIENALNIPCDERNTAYKAAKILIDKFKINSGIKIKIIKNIPSEAGLAGGSSDAAAVIKGMNEIFNLNMSIGQMLEVGKLIGADVPFCILGKTALAEGIGEKLTKLPLFCDVNLAIVKPDFGVSTPLVYNKYDQQEPIKHPDNALLINCINNKDLLTLSREMYNVLEEVTSKIHPLIKKIEKILVEEGAIGAMMSGSGPTVFGIFNDEDTALKCVKNVKKIYKSTYYAKTI